MAATFLSRKWQASCGFVCCLGKYEMIDENVKGNIC